jgi:all-trans-retinol dehydrogenase (NAD+)
LRYLAKLIRKTVLQPLITGFLLLAFYYNPQDGRVISPAGIMDTLFAVGLLYRLSLLVWKFIRFWKDIFSDLWHLRKEVIAVSGGSSGIGALIATQLAEYGIKVVILGVEPEQTSTLL